MSRFAKDTVRGTISRHVAVQALATRNATTPSRRVTQCDHFCDKTRREGKGKDGKG
jgi:hypothetical protein